jgi:hypothetical protein
MSNAAAEAFVTYAKDASLLLLLFMLGILVHKQKG